MEMVQAVGQFLPFGMPVVWHLSGEVDVFVPYADGRWRADPHENPLRLPRSHAMNDYGGRLREFLHLGPAVPMLTPAERPFSDDGPDDQVNVETGTALAGASSGRPPVPLGVKTMGDERWMRS